uniref:DUF222 domain-containing protein n=1 Tax=Saccharothrix sp. NRRL B-16314 TaxID=1463825 RepID=UPI0012DCB31A
MDVSPVPLLTEDDVFAAVAAVEASARALHRRRLELLSQVLRCGYDLDAYRRLVRANPAEVKQWIAQVELYLPLPDWSQETLVEAARSVEPKVIRQLADRIRDRIEQDSVDELDEPAAEPGDVLYVRDLPGGRVEFWGELSAETGTRFTAMLEPLATPRPEGPKDRAHRFGEAFADVITLASRSGDLPSEAGERPHISVTLDLETLRRGVGHAVLDGDRYLSAAQARRIACDAKVI